MSAAFFAVSLFLVVAHEGTAPIKSVLVTAFAIPPIAPVWYGPNDSVRVIANGLHSSISLVPYSYDDIPGIGDKSAGRYHANLGELLSGYVKVLSPFVFQPRQDVACAAIRAVGDVTSSMRPVLLARLEYFIKNEYVAYLEVNALPVLNADRLSCSSPCGIGCQAIGYSLGLPQGCGGANVTRVNNHLDFRVQYQRRKSDDLLAVMGITVSPLSIQWSDDDDSDVAANNVRAVRGRGPSCNALSSSVDIRTAALQAGPVTLDSSQTRRLPLWTYGVRWQETTDPKALWASRWDPYIDSTKTNTDMQPHLVNAVNTVLQVVMVAICAAIMLRRQRRRVMHSPSDEVSFHRRHRDAAAAPSSASTSEDDDDEVAAQNSDSKTTTTTPPAMSDPPEPTCAAALAAPRPPADVEAPSGTATTCTITSASSVEHDRHDEDTDAVAVVSRDTPQQLPTTNLATLDDVVPPGGRPPQLSLTAVSSSDQGDTSDYDDPTERTALLSDAASGATTLPPHGVNVDAHELFAAPQRLPRVLAVCVASGCHLLSATVATVLLCWLGCASALSPGSVLTLFVGVYILCAPIAGFISAHLALDWAPSVPYWPVALGNLSFGISGIVAIAVANAVAQAATSSHTMHQAIPLRSLVVLFCFMALFSWVGSIVGRRQARAGHRLFPLLNANRDVSIARKTRPGWTERLCSRNAFCCVVVSIMSFSNHLVEMEHVMFCFSAGVPYLQYGFLLHSIVMSALITALSTSLVVAFRLSLSTDDGCRWRWLSFVAPSGFGLPFLLVSPSFWLHLSAEGWAIYATYSLLFLMMYALMLGSVGFLGVSFYLSCVFALKPLRHPPVTAVVHGDEGRPSRCIAEVLTASSNPAPALEPIPQLADVTASTDQTHQV